MQSYRKRIAIQSQHKPEKKISERPKKAYYPEVKAYLLKAINLYQKVSKQYEPLSDEWTICQDDLFKFKTDFDFLENGTHEERREVIEKYGRSIS